MLTIADPDLKKGILATLASYEVNESGKQVDGAEGSEIIIDADPVGALHKAINADSTLTIFSAAPGLDEGGRIRTLLDNGIIRPHQLVYVGLRRFSKEEMGFIMGKNVRNYPMKEITFTSNQEVCDAAMQVSRQRKELVLLADLSVLDPVFFSGTDEPGGMTSRELIYFLQRFRLLKNLKTVIITGFDKEGPIEVLAKLIAELS